MRIDAADALTFSRFAAAAALLAHAALPAARQRARWALAVFAWGVVSDWVDGTIARRRGATPRGALLDREADSFLTLGAAFAASRAARLGPFVLASPAARYAVAAARLYAPPVPDGDEERWDRATGVAQMAVFALALWPSGLARALARAISGPTIVVRGAALAAQLERGARHAGFSGPGAARPGSRSAGSSAGAPPSAPAA